MENVCTIPSNMVIWIAPQGSRLETMDSLLYWNFPLANTIGLVFRRCSIDVKLEGGDI